jgi:hypothetical protein
LGVPIFDREGTVRGEVGAKMDAAAFATLSDLGYEEIVVLGPDGVAASPLAAESHSHLLQALAPVAVRLTRALSAPASEPFSDLAELEENLTAAIAGLIDGVTGLPFLVVPGPARGGRLLQWLDEAVAGMVTALFIGGRLDLPPPALNALAHGMLLRDIAALSLPAAALQRRGPLSNAERTQIEQHATIGFELLHSLGWGHPATRMVVKQHHERLDGSGYPEGVGGLHRVAREAGERFNANLMIGLAEVAGVSDTFTALNATRSYRGRVPYPQVRAELETFERSALSRQSVATLMAGWRPPVDWSMHDSTLRSISRHAPQAQRSPLMEVRGSYLAAA